MKFNLIINCTLLSLGVLANAYSDKNKFKLEFYTQYHQFYLSDKASLKKTGDVNFWTDQAYKDRLAIGDGILGVGTECYGPIKGELQILEKVNVNFDSKKFDHIVESSLDLKSGQLEVSDCPTSHVHLKIIVNPGIYRIRIYSSNLKSVKGDEGDDYYKIEIWPGKSMDRTVLKRYSQQ